MNSDDLNHKSSNNIIILQQIEDCRDRNDTVLQFTIDPLTFSQNSQANSTTNPQYSINDLKAILDEDLVKNFTLTSSSNELIFSAVNCSLLLAMRVLTSLRKKLWMIITSNAYLDIYTNCIVKTFYFEKYSQSKLFSVTAPTAIPNGSVPAFVPRANVKRTTSNSSTTSDDPLSNDADINSSNGPAGSPVARHASHSNSATVLPNSRTTSHHEVDEPQSKSQAAPVRRESLRRQPPPPPSSISSMTDPPKIVSSPTKTAAGHPSMSRSNSNDNYSGESANHDDSHYIEGSTSSKKVTAPRGSITSATLSASQGDSTKSSSAAKNAQKVSAVPSSSPSPTVPASPSSVTVNDHQPSPNPSTYSTPSTTPYKSNVEIQPSHIMTTIHEDSSSRSNIDQDNQRDNEEPVEEAAPAAFGSIPLGREDSFLFGSPLGLLGNSRSSHAQSMSSMPTSFLSGESTGSPTSAGSKNSEYFRKLKEAQDAERQRQLEEESKLSAYELQKKREAEAEILQHESSKTAHYARLGATFVNRGSPLVGGAAGRGPVPTGRLGGRGSR